MSTFGAFFTAYGGYWFCLVMKDHMKDRIQMLKKWGILAAYAIAISLSLSVFMPYNKKLYTGSFALVTVGISGASLLLMVLLVDFVKGKA